jgi:hypothetical protein
VKALLLLAIFAAASGVAPTQSANSSDPAPPAVMDAKLGIFEAFQTHPLVGLGDHHRMAQELDFYAALVRDKRFATDVGNVVVEFGDASQQAIVDRYLSGEDIPYEQLRKVWADTAGWIPTVVGLGYMNFYAQVRAANLALPPESRIHVWLGDSPIDWSSIKVASDLAQVPERDRYVAGLISTQILAKKKKALVIYGTYHFYGEGSLKSIVEQQVPRAFFVVTPYIGFIGKSCSDAFEQKNRSWPTPAIVSPVRDTLLVAEMRSTGCRFVESMPTGKMTDAQRAQAAAEEDEISGVAGDALLYLGPAASLTWTPFAPDMYLDADFRKEIIRRVRVHSGGEPSDTWPAVEDNPMSPQYIHPYGGLQGANR